MIRFFLVFIVIFCSQVLSYSQTDTRQIVAVSKFTADFQTKYSRAITEKVIEMLTRSKRFNVVDRTSFNDIVSELNLQSTDYFEHSSNITPSDKMIGADYIISGHIRQINVAKISNVDGSVGGYKASLSFTLKIIETSTTLSTEAQSFESKNGNRALSPERAVDEAIRTLEKKLSEYFTKNFPVNIKLQKILSSKKDEATVVLIGGGDNYNLKENDKFIVQEIEMIDGKPYPQTIGKIKIVKIAGPNFSECSVLKGGVEIFSKITNNKKLNCSLIKD